MGENSCIDRCSSKYWQVGLVSLMAYSTALLCSWAILNRYAYQSLDCFSYVKEGSRMWVMQVTGIVGQMLGGQGGMMG